MTRIAALLISLCLSVISGAAWGLSGTDVLTGKPVDVKPGKRGTVVVFLSSKCPCSNSHVGILKNLAKEHRDFAFVAVHSNADETMEAAKTYFGSVDLAFPVLQDDGAKIADEMKAIKTPHAFVLGADGKILYKGGVTNSNNGEKATTQFLKDAIADLEAGREVKVAEGRTLGCAISRGEKNVW